MFGYIDSNGILRPMAVEDVIPQRAVFRTEFAKKIKSIGKKDEENPKGTPGKKRLLQSYQRAPALEEGVIRYAFQIMSSPVKTLQSGESLANALLFFKDSGFTWAPVLKGSKLIGLLSELDSHRWVNRETKAVNSLNDQPLDAIMRSRVITSSPREDIRNIAKLFGHKKIEVLPVLKDDGGLAGIITKGDLIEHLMKMNTFERRG